MGRKKYFFQDKQASMSIEAALYGTVFLLLLLSFLLLFSLRFTQFYWLKAQINVAKEVSLALASYYGYSEQEDFWQGQKNKLNNNILSKNKKEQSRIEEQLGEKATFIKQLLKQWGKEGLATYISTPLLGERLRYYLEQGSKNKAFKSHMKNWRYFLRQEGVGTEKSSYFKGNTSFKEILLSSAEQDEEEGIIPQKDLVYLDTFANFPLYFYKVEQHLRIPIPTWKGSVVPEVKQKGGEEETNNVWSWHNFKRGRYFAKKYEGNLPDFFPVIQGWKKGEASMIKSIDLTTASYQEEKKLEETIAIWLQKLAAFQGAKYEKENKYINIEEKDIRRKKLLLIYPKNAKAWQKKLLRQMHTRAKVLGIDLILIEEVESNLKQK